MQLIYYPDQRLMNKSKDVSTIASKQKYNYRKLLAVKMWDIMYEKKGIGLAAPQIGLNLRMFVWNQNGFGQAIWNPVLSCLSGSVESIEGCLSLPGVNVIIQRAVSSILLGEGLNGKKLKFIGGKKTTRIWQHEIDHLDGKLIIDYLDKDGARIRAIEFINSNAKLVLETFGIIMDRPEILPGPEGSVDLHWDYPKYEMLINIPASPTDKVSFYGDDYNDIQIKGSFDSYSHDNRLVSWFAEIKK